jgi:hypothetical protein
MLENHSPQYVQDGIDRTGQSYTPLDKGNVDHTDTVAPYVSRKIVGNVGETVRGSITVLVQDGGKETANLDEDRRV